MRNCLLTLGLIVAFQFLAGCSGDEKVSKREPVFPVAGKVSYKGQPVSGADVMFFCQEKNMSSFARTDEQGKFKLTTYSSFDGAPAGKFVITISKPDPSAAATKEPDLNDPSYDPGKIAEIGTPGAVVPKSPIPMKYANTKTTDLFATVTPDNQTPDVNLELND